MLLNFLLNRTLQLSAEHVRFGVVLVLWSYWSLFLLIDSCVRNGRHIFHSAHLSSILDFQFKCRTTDLFAFPRGSHAAYS